MSIQIPTTSTVQATIESNLANGTDNRQVISIGDPSIGSAVATVDSLTKNLNVEDYNTTYLLRQINIKLEAILWAIYALKEPTAHKLSVDHAINRILDTDTISNVAGQ